MPRGSRLILACAFLAGCTSAPPPQRIPGGTAAPADAAAGIRPVDFRARIGFLADDALRGRDTPSPGLDAAAAYVASEFRSFGLEPAGDSGSYVQRYPYRVRTLRAADVALELRTGAQAMALRFGSDYYVAPGAGVAAGPLTYLGRAATPAPAAAGSLAGRIAVLELAGASFQQVNAVRAAVREAGAAGMILLLDSATAETAIAQRAANVRAGRGSADVIPVAYLRADRGRALLQAGGVTQTAAGRLQPLAGVTGRLSAPLDEVTHYPPNAAGILRGSDPALRDTYVVVSAHMDHVGVGRPDARGDSIYNGADDDASGTSAVLELAEAFASLPVPPARSIIFVAVSGEEKGLLGSAYFAEHMPVPADRVIANINIDMIGRNAPDTVVAIGQEYSSLGPLVQAVRARHPELGLVVAPDLWPDQRFFFRSDHFNFAKQEIPAIFFFTGTHEDYHRPSDHVEKIDLDKITRITRLIYHLAHELATAPQAPAWTEPGLAEVRRLTR